METNTEKHQEPTLNQMLGNLGYEDKSAEDEIVPEEQTAEPVPPQNNEKVRIPLIVGIASLLVGVPLAIVLMANGGNKQQIASQEKTEAVATNTPDPVRTKEQQELEKAKTDLFIESQKDQPTASASPSPSATATSTPKTTPTPELTPAKAKSKESGKEEDGASSSTQQEIAQLRAEIASLKKSQATQAKAPVQSKVIAQATSKATPVRATQIAQAAPHQPKVAPSNASTPKIAAEPGKSTVTTVKGKDNWEEVAAASSYGGKEEPKSTASGGSSEPVEQQSIGALRLPVGVSVAGRTGSPLAMSVNKGNKATDKGNKIITVISEQPIQVNGGWSIPAGSNFEFAVQVGEDGLVQATSGKVFISNTEVKIPSGAFALATQKGDPLMASIGQANGNEIADSDTKGAVWSGLTEVGKALVRAGDTNITSNSGLGSTVTTVNNPNPNILGAGASGVFGTLAQRNNNRAEASNKRLESTGMVATLPASTKVQIYVVHAAAFNPPDGSVNAIVPPPAPPTAAETEPLPLPSIQKQVARKSVPEQAEPKLPESLRGLD
jgi:hypothetical protein